RPALALQWCSRTRRCTVFSSRFPIFFCVSLSQRMPIDWSQYKPGEFYDELFAAPGTARPSAAQLANYLASLGTRELAERQADAERAIAEMGITFTVYTEGQNIDRAWPFDVIPRTIELAEWQRIEAGLMQRL